MKILKHGPSKEATSMRTIFVLALLACELFGQQPSQQIANPTLYPNGGTSAGHLVKLSGAPSSAAVTTSTSDTSGIIGIAVNTAAIGSNVQVATGGIVPCWFDGPVTAGDYVQNSSTSNGDCSDVGASMPTTGSVVGQVMTSGTKPGRYPVSLGIGHGGGSGSTGVTIKSSGVTVGTEKTIDLYTSPGILLTPVDTGTEIAVTVAPDTAVLQTQSATQAGTALKCADPGVSAVHFTCAMNPTLTAYTPGMVVNLTVGLNGTGGSSDVNIDTLGAIPLVLYDGTNPTSSSLVAGRVYPIWYDGTHFRLPNTVSPAGTLETLSFCTLSATTPTASTTYYEGGALQTAYNTSWADAVTGRNSSRRSEQFFSD